MKNISIDLLIFIRRRNSLYVWNINKQDNMVPRSKQSRLTDKTKNSNDRVIYNSKDHDHFGSNQILYKSLA